MSDRYGVIWTQVRGQPEKLADMVLTDTQLRITKTEQAFAERIPGVSLLHDLAGERLLAYERIESRSLPPQLAVLLPPADNTNPQRRILHALLERDPRRNLRGLPFALQQWEMLLFAGRNGLGHLDVFADDGAAASYYQERATPRVGMDGAALWLAFRHFVEQTANADEEDTVIETLGPTPGVSGFVPKLLSRIALDADGGWSGALFGETALAAMVKVEQRLYPGLLALENLAYDYHRRAGLFAVPRTWLRTISHRGEEVTLLAVERFDRSAGRSLPQESFFSLLHTGNRSKYQNNTDGSMEDLGRIFGVVGLPMQDKENWFLRLVMALLTGNGDLHSENMALLGGVGDARLSPLFDPAPMRAYRGRASHDLLSALPFAGIGGVLQDSYRPCAASGQTPPDLLERVLALGKHLALPPRRLRAQIAHLLAVTQDYAAEAVAVLESLPPESRRNTLAPAIAGFAQTLRDVRAAMSKG